MATVASLVPVSPTQVVFGSTKKDAGKNEGDSCDMGGSEGKGSDAEEGTSSIEPKEFFWDQFLVYISTIIALLTVLDVTLQFFRGGGLACRLPSSFVGENSSFVGENSSFVGENCSGFVEDNPSIEIITRDQVVFVNTFCQQSLSLAEYYPLFVLIQGLLLAAPQYLWASLFVGQFDFFFGLVRQLDRLRSSKTGDYREKNFDIVNKLDKQFPREWKWVGIFSLYIVKLLVQLLVVLVALIINSAVFQQKYFAFTFDCPEDFDPANPPKGWWLPFEVSCVFSSFRLHLRLQNVNYFLLVLAFGAIVYGLIWCGKRHVNALGYQEVAKFAFSSCLSPDEYVNEPFFKRLLKPGISNDLDFLLLRLFRADAGHGRVFKDIQVAREIQRMVERDHELLHLYVEATKDESRNVDLREAFRVAGFSTDPEREVFHTLKENALGNIRWESINIPTIRNIVFGFLQFVEKNDLALDISFGSTGYSLILARAFKDVISLNFHPFYSNDEEIYHLEHFHADYCTLKFQENILTKGTEKFTKLEEAINREFDGPFPEARLKKQANFVLVGPFTDESKIATVNLFLERQKNAYRYAKYCLLMYIRPLKIGPRDVSKRFCRYTPPAGLFNPATDGENLKKKQFQNTVAAIRHLRATNNIKVINPKKGIFSIVCSETMCQFEFTIFEFKGVSDHPPEDPRPIPPGGTSQAGNIALIIPSQMLTQLDQANIRKFMDGDMAIQLQTRSPENPIQFILPTPNRPSQQDRVPDNDTAQEERT